MKKSLLIVLIGLFASCYAFAQIQVGQTLFGTNEWEASGADVQISEDGQVLFIVGKDSLESSEIRIHDLINGEWVYRNTLQPYFILNDFSQKSIAISESGDRIAIGNPNYDVINLDYSVTPKAGIVCIFDWSGTQWQSVNGCIEGSVESDNLGYKLAFSKFGTQLAVFSWRNEQGWTIQEIEVYQKMGFRWVRVGNAIEETPGGNLDFASFTDIDLVGAGFFGDVLAIAGKWGWSRVFVMENETWVQKGSRINIGANNLLHGHSISINKNADHVIIGNPLKDVGNNLNGEVRVFRFIDDDWVQIGNTLVGDFWQGFGADVEIADSGQTIAVGNAHFTNGILPGYVNTYNLIDDEWVLNDSIIGEHETFGQYIKMTSDAKFLAISAPRHDTDLNAVGLTSVYELEDEVLINVEDPNEYEDFTIFPNPTNDKLYFKGIPTSNFLVEIYSNNGSLLTTKKVRNNELSIKNLPDGIYFLSIIGGETTIRKKIIKY